MDQGRGDYNFYNPYLAPPPLLVQKLNQGGFVGGKAVSCAPELFHAVPAVLAFAQVSHVRIGMTVSMPQAHAAPCWMPIDPIVALTLGDDAVVVMSLGADDFEQTEIHRA